jgi:bacterioferritin (cytochrome b1)
MQGRHRILREKAVKEEANATRRLLEEILAKGEEHAEDLSSMLSVVAPATRVEGQSREPDRR